MPNWLDADEHGYTCEHCGKTYGEDGPFHTCAESAAATLEANESFEREYQGDKVKRNHRLVIDFTSYHSMTALRTVLDAAIDGVLYGETKGNYILGSLT